MVGAFSDSFGARLGDDLVHLAEDVQASFQGLAQGDLHDLFGDTVDLDVHLQGGDALVGTGNLEVHVAQVVFVTEDVGQDGELLAFLDQAHGDTGDRRLDRHTGIHQRQGGAAHGGHRAGTVGLGDLGNHANGVGELVLGRQHGGDATTGQTAMADFTTTRAAHAAALAYRERREVVVQHEGVLALAFQGIQQLGITRGAEGRDDQGLGFATGEQRGTVGLAEHADFDAQRTHGTGVTTVDTRLAVDDVLANGAVFQQAEYVLDLGSRELALFLAGEQGHGLVAQLAQTVVAVLLDGDGIGLGDRFAQALP